MLLIFLVIWVVSGVSVNLSNYHITAVNTCV